MSERTERRKRLDGLRKKERVQRFGEIRAEIKKMVKYDVDPLDFINGHIKSYRGRKKQKLKELKSASDKIQKRDLKQEILVLEDCISELENLRKQVYNRRRHKKTEMDGIEKRRIMEEKDKNLDKPEKSPVNYW